MKRLRELIKKFCPEGVPYIPIAELGTLTRGKRFVHADAVEDGIPCIHYGELYTYYGLWTEKTKSFVRKELSNQLRYAQKNDVIIVGAGENDTDIGIAVAYLGDKNVAVHDACYILRQNNDPRYISYCLRTSDYHKQIKKYVSTGKICAISAEGIGKARIPIPPLEVQREVVQLLDNFTDVIEELTVELTAELTARKKQYEFYRQKIITFDETMPVIPIREVAKVTIGEFVHKNKQNSNAPFPVFNGGITNTGYYDDFNREANKIIISARGANAGYVNRVFTRYWSGNSCYTVDVKNPLLNWNYVYFWLKTNEGKLIGKQQKGGIPAVSKKQVEDFLICVPNIEEQERIVSILEKFEKLCDDICECISAEIEARRKQYEYYRDKLLTFKEA